MRHDPIELAKWQQKFREEDHASNIKPVLQMFGKQFGNLLVGPESDAEAVTAVEAAALADNGEDSSVHSASGQWRQ